MLLLDSEALSALAHGPAGRRKVVRGLVLAMREREQPVATVSAVLAEVVRGRPQDAAVFNAVRRDRVEVHSVDPQVGIRAGQLMGAARMNSTHAVDAFVVAVADVQGGALIATVDSDDIGRLARQTSRVAVADIS
jgi:predicted nucleic acid-binding protein